jgi:nucleotide-binding universal stress UspA family protein
MVRVGEPNQVIPQVATEARAELIVMGTHGRHGLRRLLLGSVAEAVVQSAPCPVLTMHTVARAAAWRIDGSRAARDRNVPSR